MSFLTSIEEVLAKKSAKRSKNVNRSDLADKLDITRAELVDALERELDQGSPRFRGIMNKWRSQWLDLFDFNLRPEQEKKYLEVLKDRSE